MQGILNVTAFPETIADFEEKHGEWERSIQRYELASGEPFNTGVKKSIILQNVAKNLRTLLQMQSSRPHEELVATKVRYLQTSTVHDSVFLRSGAHPKTSEAKTDPNAMDVDSLTRRGTGGKNRDKGKGKAKD